jgi:hypothetical protein
MIFGVPPPNQDPMSEGELQRTPKQRLEGMVYGLAVVTVVVLIAAVVLMVL